MVKFRGSIKQFTPKKLVSGDNSLRILLEVNIPDQDTLEGLAMVILSDTNKQEGLTITIE